MYFKVSFLFLILSLVCFINTARGKPRDVQQAKDDDLIKIILERNEIKPNLVLNSEGNQEEGDDDILVVRQCEFEEATEHDDCNQICIPKGYTYGLCVNYKCNCV